MHTFDKNRIMQYILYVIGYKQYIKSNIILCILFIDKKEQKKFKTHGTQVVAIHAIYKYAIYSMLYFVCILFIKHIDKKPSFFCNKFSFVPIWYLASETVSLDRIRVPSQNLFILHIICHGGALILILPIGIIEN